MIKLNGKIQRYVFPIMDIALNGINYFFHIFISWYLIPNDYGILNSLLSISAILLVAGISVQTFTAKEIANSHNKEEEINKIFKICIYFIIIVFSIITLFMSPLIKLTRGNSVSLYLVLLVFTINIILSIYRGVFQGKEEFFNLNISFYIEVISKVIFLYITLKIFPNINSVLLSIVFGMSLSLIHSISKNKYKVSTTSINLKETTKKLFKVYVASFFFYYFTSLDMLIINYYLPEYSGIYAVVLKYSQLLLFVCFSVITVFIPFLSKYNKDSYKFNKIKKILLLIIVVLSSISLVFYKYIMPLTVSMFFDSKYSLAKEYIFPALIPYIFLVLCFYTINIHIIKENTSYLWTLFISSILITILLNIFNSSIGEILNIETIFYGLLFIALSLQINFVKKRRGEI